MHQQNRIELATEKRTCRNLASPPPALKTSIFLFKYMCVTCLRASQNLCPEWPAKPLGRSWRNLTWEDPLGPWIGSMKIPVTSIKFSRTSELLKSNLGDFFPSAGAKVKWRALGGILACDSWWCESEVSLSNIQGWSGTTYLETVDTRYFLLGRGSLYFLLRFFVRFRWIDLEIEFLSSSSSSSSSSTKFAWLSRISFLLQQAESRFAMYRKKKKKKVVVRCEDLIAYCGLY